jgi:hypothetical protein
MTEMIDRLELVAKSVFEAGQTAGAKLDDEFWRLLVRTQVETMRDPTPEMLAAGEQMNSVEDVWRAMIEQILV